MNQPFFRIAQLPPYPLGEIATAVRDARLEGRDVIDLSQVNPAFEPPAAAVDKLVQCSLQAHNHRYSASQGITRLRTAGCSWYQRRFGVELDPEREVVVTLGTKEGMAHLLLSVVSPGDTVLVPTPSYPIHTAAVFLAGASFVGVPLYDSFATAEEQGYRLTSASDDFFTRLQHRHDKCWPRPKVLILSFPHNPTTSTVTEDFFERLVAFCKKNQVYVVHDFAYADLTFEAGAAPSILSVPGAKDVAVEAYSLSKGFSLAGWRVALFVGNPQLVEALKRIKGYIDTGAFQPLQIAAATLLERPEKELVEYLGEITSRYSARRDVLVEGLSAANWTVSKPRGSVFVWAGLPQELRSEGSLAVGHRLLRDANVAACPGIGFDADADNYIRFALVEPEHRLRQAVRAIAERM